MNNHWDLYSTDPRWQRASFALDAAWDEAKLLVPGLPSKERARAARQHVEKVMQAYAAVGADDSEPHARLHWLIEKHFGC